MPVNRADSHTSAARFVRPHGWQKKTNRREKCIWGEGSKPCWEDNTAKIPADIIRRLRARHHNPKDRCQQNQPGIHDYPCAKNANRQTNLLKQKNQQTKKTNEKEWHGRKNDCRENLIASKDHKCPFYKLCRLYTQEKNMRPNGLRYWRWGGRGLCLGAEKTRSQKNARKCRRIPSVQCTLC